ncbi:MAG: acetyl-CoA carboxylase carboxyltransferase subunit alpha [Bdellovibrionales bacterium]|nr:acetyl-CoA carboxylase carboxyltransferase subunit alpha [Bdellovibrionales bacterium]
MTIIENPLEFERPLVELEIELEALRDEIASGEQSKTEEYAKIESRVDKLRNDLYARLTPYQRVQLSRHFDRPFTLDFIRHMTTNFVEFHGDRAFRDDPAIVGGTALLGDIPVMIVGHERGRSMQERIRRNFGMPQPEGYRKAERLFRMAEKFSMPLITLIDTQGAYPGLEAEERGQAEAIAKNLEVLSELTIPVISVVIGEGGSGGALALGVSNRILMLENACYSVITPEGCASILWHTKADNPAAMAQVAAEALQVTADRLHSFGIVDEIVPEPMGGAHWNHKEAAENLLDVLIRHIKNLSKLSTQELVDDRYNKFRKIGEFTGDA